MKHGNDGSSDGSNCECFEDTGHGGCRIRANKCYIENNCRADAGADLGTTVFNTKAVDFTYKPTPTAPEGHFYPTMRDLDYVDNKCRKCDSAVSTSAVRAARGV
jgi:hypothetical protein